MRNASQREFSRGGSFCSKASLFISCDLVCLRFQHFQDDFQQNCGPMLPMVQCYHHVSPLYGPVLPPRQPPLWSSVTVTSAPSMVECYCHVSPLYGPVLPSLQPTLWSSVTVTSAPYMVQCYRHVSQLYGRVLPSCQPLLW